MNLRTIEAKAFVPAKDFDISKQFYLAIGFSLVWSTEELAYFRHGRSRVGNRGGTTVHDRIYVSIREP